MNFGIWSGGLGIGLCYEGAAGGVATSRWKLHQLHARYGRVLGPSASQAVAAWPGPPLGQNAVAQPHPSAVETTSRRRGPHPQAACSPVSVTSRRAVQATKPEPHANHSSLYSLVVRAWLHCACSWPLLSGMWGPSAQQRCVRCTAPWAALRACSQRELGSTFAYVQDRCRIHVNVPWILPVAASRCLPRDHAQQ